jgi:hypothetical protein
VGLLDGVQLLADISSRLNDERKDFLFELIPKLVLDIQSKQLPITTAALRFQHNPGRLIIFDNLALSLIEQATNIVAKSLIFNKSIAAVKAAGSSKANAIGKSIPVPKNAKLTRIAGPIFKSGHGI